MRRTDPLEHYAELLALEVRPALATREGAVRYGVMLNDELAVNRPETERLRATIAKQRGELPLFNFCPPVEKLRES